MQVVEGTSESFKQFLHQQTVKAYGEKVSEKASEARGEGGERVKVLRKYINTRLSKIKREEGNAETHKKSIKKHLRTLATISKKDFEDMVAKFESTIK